MNQTRLKNILGEETYKYVKGDHTELFYKSYILVSSLFSGVKDKSGEPYLNHLFSVCNHCETEDEKIVALMHDLLEDTFVTEEDLRALSYPEYIIEAVSILSKKEDQKYSDYIKNIINSNNLLALKVKKQDILNNMDYSRLRKIDKKTAVRLRKKYTKNLPKIEKAIDKENNNDRY